MWETVRGGEGRVQDGAETLAEGGMVLGRCWALCTARCWCQRSTPSSFSGRADPGNGEQRFFAGALGMVYPGHRLDMRFSDRDRVRVMLLSELSELPRTTRSEALANIL